MNFKIGLPMNMITYSNRDCSCRKTWGAYTETKVYSLHQKSGYRAFFVLALALHFFI